MSLCRKWWGREHACIGKCVNALTQLVKCFHSLCLKVIVIIFVLLSPVCLSWHRDIHRLGAFLSWVQLSVAVEQQKKWQWCSIITFALALSLPQSLPFFFKTLMSFLWTFWFSNKWYFVCVRSICHWSAYLPCRVNKIRRYFCSQHRD